MVIEEQIILRIEDKFGDGSVKSAVGNRDPINIEVRNEVTHHFLSPAWLCSEAGAVGMRPRTASTPAL